MTLTFDDEHALVNAYYSADRSLKRLILQAMKEQSPRLAEALNADIKSYFESIADFDGRTVQTIIRECDRYDLLKAIRGSEKVKEKIFQNLSKRARVIMSEDMSFIGEPDLLDIEEAQQKIANVVRTLAEYGMIVLLPDKNSKAGA